eukprot:9871148-Lingulodinium_polyedra.AAC.1
MGAALHVAPNAQSPSSGLRSRGSRALPSTACSGRSVVCTPRFAVTALGCPASARGPLGARGVR